MKNKIKRLYEDWKQSKNIRDLKKADTLLKETSHNSSHFNEFISFLGSDGKRMKKYFNEAKNEFSENKSKAKKEFANFLLEEKGDGSVVDSIGLSYYPITDRSKSVVSTIEVGTPSGAPTEILRAIVGGNFYLAAQLTALNWGKLTVADRNLIMKLAHLHGKYNTGNTIVKDSGHTVFYDVETKYDVKDGIELEKKSDLSKKDFLKQAFPLTDVENMKI